MTNKVKKTFTVQKMTCTGCEAIVEDAVRNLEGVAEVRADFAKNSLAVTYDPARLSPAKMRSAVKRAGYTLEMNQDNSRSKPGSEKQKNFSAWQFAGIAVIALAAYLIIDHTVGFDFIPEVNASMGFGVLFVVGLLTSLHCVAMCGGINLSQCMGGMNAAQGAFDGGKTGVKPKLLPSLLYNLGRVTSYTVIGGVIGALGSVVSFSGWARGLVAIVSGLFMIIMGLSMTGLFPVINKITPRLPRLFRDRTRAAGSGRGPYIVGLLNGLMPCGPLQAMQVYALGTGSFLTGALSMFFFSLGTLPLMFGLGAVVTVLGSRFTKGMIKAGAVLVAVLGVVMLGRGLVLSGVSLQGMSNPSAAAAETAAVTGESGVQYITSTLTARGYPNITVQKGVPVQWNLQADSDALNGCNRTLVIPQYNLQVELKAGDNLIEFTPQQSGTFTYSCWMGMQTGRITVTDGSDNNITETASAQPDTAETASVETAASGMPCCQ